MFASVDAWCERLSVTQPAQHDDAPLAIALRTISDTPHAGLLPLRILQAAQTLFAPRCAVLLGRDQRIRSVGDPFRYDALDVTNLTERHGRVSDLDSPLPLWGTDEYALLHLADWWLLLVFHATTADHARISLFSRLGGAVIERMLTAWHAHSVAMLDPLTGVLNRRGLLESAPALLARGPLMLAFFDLNDLKILNDSRGHAAGDDLLLRTAQTLSRTLRDGDLIARVGGDEFVAAIEGDDLRIVERVIKSFQRVKISVAYGYALAPIEAPTVEEAVALADQRMYACKQRMKGRL